MLHFDTDYMEGAHQMVMKRLEETNLQQTVGYGKDDFTARAKELIRKECCAPDALVQFMVGGTQTNATVIDALLRRHEGVLAAETAHINAHESGAIEHSGHKILVLPSHDGKVCVDDVENFIKNFYADETYEHSVAPGMLYISQPTEWGTVYTLDELEALSNTCHKYNIPLYMDGARLAYALASPVCDFTMKDIARLCDVFYIGGTKCGLLFGEAVVSADASRLPHFFPLVKQHGALLAKGRLQGVQFEALFDDGLYYEVGKSAITQALRLREAFKAKGYRLPINSPSNQQFVVLPNAEMDRLAQSATFEIWGSRGETETTVRFVTSWATKAESVDKFIALL